MNEPRISYDALPEEVQQLKDRIAKLESVVEKLLGDRAHDEYLDTIEAAAYIKKTPNAVRLLVFNRQIPSIKRGKKLYFTVKDLKNWMEDGRRGKTISVLK